MPLSPTPAPPHEPSLPSGTKRAAPRRESSGTLPPRKIFKPGPFIPAPVSQPGTVIPDTLHFTFICLIVPVLLARGVYAQSESFANMLPLGAAVGAVIYRANQLNPVADDFLESKADWSGHLSEPPEAINDEIEKLYGDEEEWSDRPLVLFGRTAGLDVLVQGERAIFKPSQQLNRGSSRLSRTMHKHNISQIDIQPGQLDIFPEDQSETPVSVILPFESEPLMPVTGYDWLDQSEGMAFVRDQSMEAIAAIAEAAMSVQAQERTVGLDDHNEDIDSKDQITLFEDFGGQLYAVEPLPVYPPVSARVEAKQEMEGIIAELDFGIESIKVNATRNSDGQVLGAFEHLMKKAGHGDGDSKKEGDDTSDQSDGESTTECDEPETEEVDQPKITTATQELIGGLVLRGYALLESPVVKPKIGEKRKRSESSEDDLIDKELHPFRLDLEGLTLPVPLEVQREIAIKRKRMSLKEPGLLEIEWDQQTAIWKIRAKIKWDIDQLKSKYIPGISIKRDMSGLILRDGKVYKSKELVPYNGQSFSDEDKLKLQELEQKLAALPDSEYRSWLAARDNQREEIRKELNQYHDKHCPKCRAKMDWHEGEGYKQHYWRPVEFPKDSPYSNDKSLEPVPLAPESCLIDNIAPRYRYCCFPCKYYEKLLNTEFVDVGYFNRF